MLELTIEKYMPRKRNPSIIPRFTRAAGRRNLLSAICAQQAVAGNAALARRLVKAGSLQEYAAGKRITHQGDADDDIYMIISGSVSVFINRREIAVRAAGSHVGEMALLDSTARRSATIITREPTAVLKLPEPRVTRIARDHPEFWRRLAVELGTRLRERSKYIPEPNSVPVVFVGSSKEALAEATHVNRSLVRHKLTCRLWTQGVFQLSQTTIEDLVLAAQQCDFAILLLTPDDMTTGKGHRRASPRDNVIFELGLFMGAIGRERTFIVAPRGGNLKLPTDLLGVTHAQYDPDLARSLSQRFRPVTRTLWRRISSLGSK
jgi:predicted nucleotide-binding protein